MKKVLLSVIIPIYNAEEYLEDCLSSIYHQTFQDYEVWMIDDGSNDQSPQICDFYSKKDTRFHVLHKMNGGVSSARNLGLDQSQGNWICFLDSDDTVDKNYLENLYKAVDDKQEKLIIQGFNIIETHSKKTRLFDNHLYDVSHIYLAFERLHINRCGFPFAKLYNRNIIQEYYIRFNETINYAEDVIFMLTYLCHVSYIQTLEGAQYNYFVRRNNSLSQRIFDFKSEYTCYENYLSLIIKIKERFNIPERALSNSYNVISEYLIRRSIGALYQKKTRVKQNERIAILKSLSLNQITFLQRHYKQCNKFHKLTVFLLSKHYYYLCDLLNQGIAFRRACKHKG